MAMATRTWVVGSLQGLLGFSVAQAVGLVASAPLALASSVGELHRTMENSAVPVKRLTSVTLEIEIG
jgi:hypothetical protein